MRYPLLLLAMLGGSEAVAAPPGGRLALNAPRIEPQLKLDTNQFSMPIVDYKTPTGEWKRGKGIIIGREVAKNTTVGLGVFKMKPKTEDGATNAPFAGKSKKVALGVSLRF